MDRNLTLNEAFEGVKDKTYSAAHRNSTARTVVSVEVVKGLGDKFPRVHHQLYNTLLVIV